MRTCAEVPPVRLTSSSSPEPRGTPIPWWRHGRSTRRPALIAVLAGAVLGLGGCRDASTVVEPATLAPPSQSFAVAPDTRPGPILPQALAARLGSSNNIVPYAWPNISIWRSIRYQQVFLGSELGTSRLFKELCFRLQAAGTPGKRVVTIKLAEASVDHTTMSVVFDDNRASDPVTVLSQVEVSTGVESGGGVDDFYPCFPFSTVYVHPGGNLLVEMQVWPVGDGDLENRPSITQDACYSLDEAGCTTARVLGINALASVGSTDPAPYGLVMKLIEASAEEALQAIIDQITALELRMGIEQALSGPLDAALAGLIEDDRPAAVRRLEAYIAQVEGMRGSQLTDEEADALIATAQALIDAIAAGA